MTNTPNLAVSLLAHNLEKHPDKTAFICNGEHVSYRQLAEYACRFSAFLEEHGIRSGDRVLLVLLDSPVFAAAFLGTILHGAVAVTANTTLNADDLSYILEDSGARLLIASESIQAATGLTLNNCSLFSCGESLTGLLAEYRASSFDAPLPDADSIAFMLYTSGSTGKPKGVPHSHLAMLVEAQQYAVQVLGMTGDDLIFCASKLFFAYGLGNSLAFPLYTGATALLHSGRPSPDELVQLIELHRPTIFCTVPTIYAQIIRSTVNEKLELPMKLCVSAGEMLPASVFQEWQRLTGLEILDGIGSTEFFHIFISNYPGQAVPGSSGRPVPGCKVRLVDDNGVEVQPGEPGHLQVWGASCTPGYWNLPERSAAAILPDGFLRTGDVYLERDGYFYHQGRSDDMLKAGGQWVSPQQIEDVLRTHPAIADCAVAGYRHGGLERPAAHLMIRPDYNLKLPDSERELRKFLAERLPDYMLPVRYFFTDELPRTATGKVQRFRLRQ